MRPAAPRATHTFTSTRAMTVAVLVVVVVYVVALLVWRYAGALDPWRAEGDWRKWLWTAWRAHDPTLLPGGGDQLLADYLTAMQPPLYRLVFDGLARVLLPAQAAVVLSALASLLALVGMGLTVQGLVARTSSTALTPSPSSSTPTTVALLAGAVAVVLLARDQALFEWSAGGYPRSFGPALVALFLAAFVIERHRLALLVLVVGAGVYPSPVVPCGLALGAVVVWPAMVGVVDMRRFGRALAELVVGALGIAVLALWQNRVAPAWWGKVVSAGDVGVSLTDVGRCTWWPHPPLVSSLLEPLAEPWRVFGHAAMPSKVALQVIVSVVVAGAVVVLLRHRERRTLLPGRVLVFFAMVLVAWLAARGLAFSLYYPKRMVQHPLPLVSIILVVALVARAVLVLRLRETVLLLVLVPVLWFGGDGFSPTVIWRDRTAMKPLMAWVQTTPKDARFAGDLAPLDWIPYFGPRHAFVNFTLAHPFRGGFFTEIERRVLAVYDAVYADDASAVLAFLDREGVDYLVVDTRAFSRVESGFGHLFEPMRSLVVATMYEPRRGRFALARPPDGAVVFAGGDVVVVGREALRRSLPGASDAQR